MVFGIPDTRDVPFAKTFTIRQQTDNVNTGAIRAE